MLTQDGFCTLGELQERFFSLFEGFDSKPYEILHRAPRNRRSSVRFQLQEPFIELH